MKYPYIVNYNGTWYPAGTSVPVGVKPVEDNKPVEVEEEKYTKTDINRMAAAELKELAGKQGLVFDETEINQKANAWELSHGGISGRTAQQFITYLLSRQE